MAEFIGGILSGSLALVSDAWHNLTDVLSLMLAYAGEKVSELDITRSYSFGFKRFEVMIALVNASSLTFIGIYIVYEAIKRFINPLPINIGIMVPVGVIGLLGNFFSILVLKTNRDHNLNTKAAFAHLLYDALSSIAVIVGCIVVYISGFLWIDLAVSLIIVIMILFNSTSIIRESLRIFMQGTPPEIDPTIVFDSISGIAHVSNVHGLHIWSISSREIFLSCHICLDSPDAGINTDQIIKEVNDMLKEKYNIEHTTIQVEKQQICSLESGECCR
jgi:cobalt-zinc-cadmium efflux system protein